MGLLMISKLLCAQSNITMRTVVPPGPEIASIGKYGETPVTLNTGVISVPIPIFEIKEGRINIPISLSYHGGGIKVEESSSWVGLGWNLSAGGTISRVVRGRPDEISGSIPAGYFNPHNEMNIRQLYMGSQRPDISLDSLKWYNKNQHAAVFKKIDGEPDMFYLNVGDLNYRFYYNQEAKKFFTVPASNIQISYSGDISDGITWKIVDQNGIIYNFLDHEKTTVSEELAIGTTHLTTGWFLTSIEDPLTNSFVSFSYLSHSSTFANGVSEVSYFPMPGGNATGGGSTVPSVHYTTLSTKKIHKITFPEGEINFLVQAANRLDFPSDKAIGEINIKNTNGQIIKKVNFHQSYFEGSSLNMPPPNGNPVPDMYRYRLKLDSLSFLGASGNNKYKYQFQYSDLQVPNRLSLDQDDWGYYNNKNNQHLVKQTYLTVGNILVNLPGGNREVNVHANQMGMLKRIVYPTEGYSDFEYESNYWSQSTQNNTTYSAKEKTVSLEAVEEPEQVGALWRSYSEAEFTIHNGSNCSGGNIGYAWGEMFQFNEDVEFCPTHLKNLDLRVEGIDPENEHVYVSLAGSITPVSLPAGRYKLVMDLTHCYAEYFSMVRGAIHYWDCEEEIAPEAISKIYTGGLRIKSITDFDHLTNIVNKRTYEYAEEQDDRISSGSVGPAIQNNYFIARYEGGNNSPELNSHYFKRQSYSYIPLSTVKGSAISYRRVVENFWKNSIIDHQKEYIYTTFADFPDITESINQDPFNPSVSRDYMRGLLSFLNEYKVNNDSRTLVRSQYNEYTSISDTTTASISYGINGASRFGSPDIIVYEGVMAVSDVILHVPPLIGLYKEFTDIPLLEKTTIKTFDQTDNSKFITDVKEYQYSPSNFLVNKTVTYVLENPIKKKGINTLYPYDYFIETEQAISPEIIAVQKMLQINNVNQGISIDSYVENGSSKNLVNGQLSFLNSTSLYIDKVESLETRIPVSYVPISKNVNGNHLKHADLKNALNILEYNSRGNVLSQQMNDNIIYSYVYDLYDINPIAEVKNARRKDVFYTSFEYEVDGMGIIENDGKTGLKSKSGGFNKSLFNLSNGVYILSYWKKQSLKWDLYLTEITVNSGSYEINLTGILDEIRFYPKEAEFTSFSYIPLLGIISKCDINGRTTYYEYDAFNRLHLIKDDDGNIIKRICYNYAGQVEACGIVSTLPQWESTLLTRCQPCAANNAYTSNVQEHQEKDNNPNSPTYNTYRWVSDGINSNCQPMADWQNTVTAIRCKKNGSNQNTGLQEQEQRDNNPCSPTYQQLRWSPLPGMNWTACPLAPIICNDDNCYGEEKKCINGECEIGVKVYTGGGYNFELGVWVCYYHYEFSDASWSATFSEQSSTPCIIPD